MSKPGLGCLHGPQCLPPPTAQIDGKVGQPPPVTDDTGAEIVVDSDMVTPRGLTSPLTLTSPTLREGWGSGDNERGHERGGLCIPSQGQNLLLAPRGAPKRGSYCMLTEARPPGEGSRPHTGSHPPLPPLPAGAPARSGQTQEVSRRASGKTSPCNATGSHHISLQREQYARTVRLQQEPLDGTLSPAPRCRAFSGGPPGGLTS